MQHILLPVSSSTGPRLPKAGTNIPALDGIRGLAILLVMLYHFTLYGGMRPTRLLDQLYYQTALVGWFGVDLFFVLSGFLITGILFDTIESRHFFRNFYMRRVLRIFPLYYGVLVVVFACVPRIFFLPSEFEQLLQDQLWYWSYLVNVQIALDYWPSFPALGHFWSLAVEEQFYLVWPFLVFFFRRRILLAICMLCLFGAFFVRLYFALSDYAAAAYVLTPARMDALAVGACLALAARGPGELSALSRWSRPLVVTIGTVLGTIFLWKRGLDIEDPIVNTIGLSLLALLFGAFLLIVLMEPENSTLGRLFSNPALVFFGRYSYALYVFHHLVIYYLASKVLNVQSVSTIMGSQLPGQLLLVIVATVISLCLALLSWHLYEIHFLKLKRYFPNQINRGQSRVTQT